jgi:hypothetical protein
MVLLERGADVDAGTTLNSCHYFWHHERDMRNLLASFSNMASTVPYNFTSWVYIDLLLHRIIYFWESIMESSVGDHPLSLPRVRRLHAMWWQLNTLNLQQFRP